MRRILLPMLAVFTAVTLNAQTDLKVKFRKMNSAFMKGPTLKIDTAAKTVWVGANYVGEKIEDASSIETQIEQIASWGKKYTMIADSAEADLVVNVDFSDLVCDNPYMDWNTAETSFFYRMRYYVPSKVVILNKKGEELFTGDLPIRSVMTEVCTKTGKSEAALKGLVPEPAYIDDAAAPAKAVELFTTKISHEVRSMYEYSTVPYYKVFYTFFAKKDRALYPDLMIVNKKFGKSRVSMDSKIKPSVNKDKLEDAVFAIETLLKDKAMQTANQITYKEIIPLNINLAQLQYMLGDQAKAEATLAAISNLEGEIEFRKEVGLVLDYWAEK
jgi:hypothetical protein